MALHLQILRDWFLLHITIKDAYVDDIISRIVYHLYLRGVPCPCWKRKSNVNHYITFRKTDMSSVHIQKLNDLLNCKKLKLISLNVVTGSLGLPPFACEGVFGDILVKIYLATLLAF